MKLEQLIGEATEYDKKAMLEIKKPKSWLKSVSAFANGVGGVLIFASCSFFALAISVSAAFILSRRIRSDSSTAISRNPRTSL